MAKKRRHIIKLAKEREYYTQLLRKLDSEPTAEEESEFPQSDLLEEEHRVQAVGGRRPPGLRVSMLEHFRRYWIFWTLTAIVPFCIYLGRFDAALDAIRKSVDTNRQHIERMLDRVQQQELKLQEQGIRIEYIERDLEELTYPSE